MERGYIEKAEFVFKEKKIQLNKLYIRFIQVTEQPTGLQKTPFKVYLDNKLIGTAPLDMLAILPGSEKPNLHVVLRIDKPTDINSIPFYSNMKLSKFLGKIFKQENMIETPVGKDLVILSVPETKTHRKKKNMGRRYKKQCKKSKDI